MLASSLREHLAQNYHPFKPDYASEEFYAIVGDYYSSKGMEWTPDDEAVIKEYGYEPSDYLCFDDEQIGQIDAVLDEVYNLMTVMLPKDELSNISSGEVADAIAEFLTKCGLHVRFPVHVECPDGTQYISDYYEMEE